MNNPPDRLWRTAEPRLGVAWVRHEHGGLPVGWRVEVKSFSNGKMCVHAVADWFDGRLMAHQLDYGIELRTRRGHWLPDSHRLAQRWLWRARKALLVGRIPDGAEGLTLERLDQVLVRWQKG